ncbi:MAG: T9SS type A sorting domain-containing protein, partial [Bacteroidia bacterium]
LHNYYAWTSHHVGETDPGGWINTGIDLTTGSHILTCIWEPGIVEWYMDGYFITYEFVDFYNSMNIVANTGSANDNSPSEFLPAPDGTTPFPNTFEIDYIRAYAVLECDAEDVPLCDYTTADYNDIAVVGTYIRTGVDDVSPECPAGSAINVTSGHSFKLVATDHIVIDKDFTADEGSYFEARINECFEEKSFKPTQYLNLVTPDSAIKASKTESKKTNETHELKIYPNPANSLVTISTDENDLIKFVRLYDVVGSVVKEFSVSNTSTIQLNVSEMPKGFYSLEVKTQKNNYKKTLIIQ